MVHLDLAYSRLSEGRMVLAQIMLRAQSSELIIGPSEMLKEQLWHRKKLLKKRLRN